MNSIAIQAYVTETGELRPAPTLLLVSDGPFVRRFIAAGLRQDGYRVREVDHRGLLEYSALRARGQGEGVDAILCDTAALAPQGARALRELRRLDWVMPIVALYPSLDQPLTGDLGPLQADAVVTDVLDLDETRSTVAALLPLG
jgi:CheY-like chemotaxis protein